MVLTASQPVMTTRLQEIRATTPPTCAPAADDDRDDNEQVVRPITGGATRRQPLTLRALMGYKTKITAPGRGQFALRYVRLWPILE